MLDYQPSITHPRMYGDERYIQYDPPNSSDSDNDQTDDALSQDDGEEILNGGNV